MTFKEFQMYDINSVLDMQDALNDGIRFYGWSVERYKSLMRYMNRLGCTVNWIRAMWYELGNFCNFDYWQAITEEADSLYPDVGNLLSLYYGTCYHNFAQSHRVSGLGSSNFKSRMSNARRYLLHCIDTGKVDPPVYSVLSVREANILADAGFMTIPEVIDFLQVGGRLCDLAQIKDVGEDRIISKLAASGYAASIPKAAFPKYLPTRLVNQLQRIGFNSLESLLDIDPLPDDLSYPSKVRVCCAFAKEGYITAEEALNYIIKHTEVPKNGHS